MAIQNVLNISHRSSGFLKLFAKNATYHFITHKIFFFNLQKKESEDNSTVEWYIVFLSHCIWLSHVHKTLCVYILSTENWPLYILFIGHFYSISCH